MIPQPKLTPGDTNWFTAARLGLFIHWGLYALPARHEWVKQREELPDEAYGAYFRRFEPDLYDPKLWAKAAAEAGMKYFVVTTKHHDGFCLWDSQFTAYKATNTPYGQDLLRPMVAAFRSEGLRTGFYYSLLDWHHPEFPIDGFHPLRNHPERERFNAQRDIRQYTAYLHNQTRELLTKFAPVDIIWFDFSYPAGQPGWPEGWAGKGRDDWQSEKLVKLVRKLAPEIILNDRLDLDEGDFKTPEQYQPREWLRVNGEPVVWEACQTFSGSWGYHRDEASWKSLEQLIGMLVDTVSKGGNLLLNVGPTGRGEFDERALERLAGIGRWLRQHGRSIYGCTASAFTPPPDCRYTQNGQRLYLHLLHWPFRHVHLAGLAGRVEYAQLLHDASEVRRLELDPQVSAQNTTMSGQAGVLTIELPVPKPNVTVPVIELFLKE